jgi:hypothetical protein
MQQNLNLKNGKIKIGVSYILLISHLVYRIIKQ